MPEITEYASGSPSWADLLCKDGQAAKDFYTALLGWTWDDHPAGPDMVYTMFSHNGVPVCASAEPAPGQENLPPHWSVYVTVDDLDVAVGRTRSAGGTVIMEPFDVMDVGRMAIIQDKEGAFLRLWYPLKHAGAGKMHEPGALAWFELATTDSDSASAFYAQVFQAEAGPDPNTDFPYTLITVAGIPSAGIIQICDDWGPVPPNWGVYFGVDDVDAAAAKATELGGSVIVEPRDIPDFARFAVLRDAEGAVFNVLRVNEWPA
jgi:predicted enzyme related to lactoylglutathione lyase